MATRRELTEVFLSGRILGVAVGVKFVSTSTEQFGGEERSGGLKKSGSELGRVRRCETKLAGRRFWDKATV